MLYLKFVRATSRHRRILLLSQFNAHPFDYWSSPPLLPLFLFSSRYLALQWIWRLYLTRLHPTSLPAINFARTQGDSWWVQQTERAMSNVCSRIAPATQQVKRAPRSWDRPPTRRVARQHPVPHRCQGSRKRNRWLKHPVVAAEAVAKLAARSYPRAIPTWAGTSVTPRDAPYPEVNEVRFRFLLILIVIDYPSQKNPQQKYPPSWF